MRLCGFQSLYNKKVYYMCYNDFMLFLSYLRFPNDPATYDIDKQFLWGPALLISPVLKENATSAQAVFPKGI